jgi:hypothetical protein
LGATLSCAAAIVLAGCGGGTGRVPVLTALRLQALAQQVADGHGCGGPLVAAAITAVNRGEVPATLQEPLLSDANRIQATCSRAAAGALAARLRP